MINKKIIIIDSGFGGSAFINKLKKYKYKMSIIYKLFSFLNISSTIFLNIL
jgi:hypothetical protein